MKFLHYKNLFINLAEVSKIEIIGLKLLFFKQVTHQTKDSWNEMVSVHFIELGRFEFLSEYELHEYIDQLKIKF